MDQKQFESNYSVYEVEFDRSDKAEKKLCAYFIESTAPVNIDDVDCVGNSAKRPNKTLEQHGLQGIVERLAESDDPNLVISVHGFNCPRDFIFERYRQAYEAVNDDERILNSETVCIGYRWPSERMIRDPLLSGIAAAPGLLVTLFVLGLVCVVAVSCAHSFNNTHYTMTTILGLLAVSVPLMLLTLRLAVYFRDAFRASAFGIPDLVDLIQDIDEKLERALPPERRNKVQLSFMGHSMGAYVVTGAVRILSDVFARLPDPLDSHPPVGSDQDSPKHIFHAPFEARKIGSAFNLKRLVLVSPDIPSESLFTGRASFLAASLQRFEEAFLFSSKDDVVLRLISRAANYFSVPTLDRRFGYRLGNVAVDDVSYGIVKGVNLEKIRIGPMTIAEMQKKVLRALTDKGSPQIDRRPLHRFSYFDCTDCVDRSHIEICLPGALEKLGIGKVLVPISSYLFRNKLTLPAPFNRIGVATHFALLFWYIAGRWPDVHSGYFQSLFLRQLIYRVTCLGWDKAVQAFDGFDNLDRACKEHQIKVRLAHPAMS
jgi:pimeloyl-ACP methyl ester carboxylesterase